MTPNLRRPRPSFAATLPLALVLAAGAALPLHAQDAPASADGAAQTRVNGRRPASDEPTTLAFNDVKLEDIVPFIVETTGKVVIPAKEVLTYRVTIINDEPLPQMVALDYVFLALQLANVSVVETEDLIILRPIADAKSQNVPVIGPDDSVLNRTDLGTIAEKIYRLDHNTAENVHELLEDEFPDYALILPDVESNQIVVRGTIALLQRMEQLIGALDRPSSGSLITQTFNLRYADAEKIAEQITDLYEAEEGDQQQGNQGGRNFARFFGGNRGGEGEEETQGAQTSENLRVSANPQQNSVTVLAEPAVMAQIAQLISSDWDRPLEVEAVIPRVYQLEHTDPVKVRDMLQGLFGEPTGDDASSGGVGRLAGQFTFEALPDAGRLVAIAKSPDNFFVVDEIIKGLDQPQTVGLPEILELKHANAEELAEQLNTLLSTEGTLAQLQRQEEGLSADDSSTSPFGQEPEAEEDDGATDPELITFWWQRAQPPTDNRGTSNLVGRIRVVPVWRQNAVMVLSPPEYRASVVELITQLDQPGRQVLISAIIAEIALEDATALGLRWSSQAITPANGDNSVGIGTTTTAQENNFLGGLFDTSVLDATADLNLLLQALNEKTAVNILSEPRIFTADNQEAEFFDGQDIPFITDSQTTDQGGLTQSTDYRAVGIQLRVRPRITVRRDVDLRVNLELSSLSPELAFNGQFIVDRRETTTQLIIQDGQTVVISGILRSEESDVKRKVPFLGDIPLVGLLFTSIEKSVESTELVAFITPLVVDNETDLDRVNDPYRRRLEQLREGLGGAVQDLQEESGYPGPLQLDPPGEEPVLPDEGGESGDASPVEN